LYVNGWPSEVTGTAPIIDAETWAKVSELRLVRAKFKVHREGSPNLLLGLLWDSYGRRMTVHDYARQGKIYRHYISSGDRWARAPAIRRFRVRADQLENLIAAFLVDFMNDRERLRALLLENGSHGLELDALAARGREASGRLIDKPQCNARKFIKTLVGRIELTRDDVGIIVRAREVERLLRTPASRPMRTAQPFGVGPEPTIMFRIPVHIVRVERSLHLPDLEHIQGSNSDPKLIDLMQQARRARELVEVEGLDVSEVRALLHLKSKSAVARRIRLTYLAPDISLAIMEGRQPSSLTRRALLESNIPMDWSLQRRLFGFAPQAPLQMGEARY
jgi:hypothetical protein